MTKRVHISQNHDVCICRPSIYGNPFSYKDNTLATFKVSTKREAIQKHWEYLISNRELQEAVEDLRDKTIACFCKENETCHGDNYIKWLNIDRKIERLFG